MSARTRAATGIWRARAVRAAGDRGYVAYMVLTVGLVMVAPVVRAVWVSATSAEGVALLASPDAPGVAVLVVAAMWAGGLLLGRDRGPALHPPFLTHALADSDLPRSDTFRGPLLRAGALVTAVTTIIAGLVGGSLASHGLSDLLGAAIFTIVGLAVGVVATVAWLAGQAFPRAAAPVAIAVIALGLATVVFPLIQPFTPLGWVGLAYPGSSAPHALVALVALTSALLAAVPVLLNRLGLAELEAQAVRWDSATAYATGMDLSGAAALYQRRPYVGRRARAIRSRSRVMWTFLIRDAVGAVRTPGRLIVGVTALIAGAAILAFAFAPGTPGWLLGAVAGLVVFFGLGPLTDGVRHAASVAGDFPLYGISDQHLLAVHAQFPLAIVVLVLLTAVVVCSILTGIPPAAPLVGALALGPIALLARVSSALKGSLPPALLAPIPTPMGDLGAAARLAWALDGVLLAAAAGAAAALVFQAPVVLVAVTAALLGVGFSRWRHRR